MANRPISLKTVNRDVERAMKFLEKATTQEPKSNSRSRWTNQMRDVITFKTEGRNKGSLERFAEANDLPKGVYNILREAVAYGAHSSRGSSRGILAFPVTDASMEKLEGRLTKLFARRDADGNGKLDAAEQKAVAKTKNGKAYLEGRTQLRGTSLRGLRSEYKFSQKVNYLVDLLYSNGSIRGPEHIDQLCEGKSRTEQRAIRQGYAAVSRYVSRGRTSEQRNICRDQRREVTRALSRTFGARLDDTEKAISALRVPRD